MNQVDVSTSETLVVAAGPPRQFIHIQVLDQDCYFKYDGDSTAVTTSNGIKVAAGGYLNLNNDGIKPIYGNAIYAITASGTADLRIQGD